MPFLRGFADAGWWTFQGNISRLVVMKKVAAKTFTTCTAATALCCHSHKHLPRTNYGRPPPLSSACQLILANCNTQYLH